MANIFKRRPSADMYDLLMKNPKGKLADEVISERFPEFNEKVCQFFVMHI